MDTGELELNHKKRVLIVDDHILFQDGLASLIKLTPDFEVAGCAGSVDEAVECARRLKPDIILMDFNLPDGTGLDATRLILNFLPACQIIFLTVSETDTNLFVAIRHGAKGYLLKNIPTATLLSSLRGLDRGEIAMSRTMMSRVIDGLARPDHEKAEMTGLLKKLSPRELEILRELEGEATNLEIAKHLFLSENTVKHHIRSILEKLGVENRHQALEIVHQAS
jgi:two-component system, NarL family, nitrate/nitrite response regulator NarL